MTNPIEITKRYITLSDYAHAWGIPAESMVTRVDPYDVESEELNIYEVIAREFGNGTTEEEVRQTAKDHDAKQYYFKHPTTYAGDEADTREHVHLIPQETYDIIRYDGNSRFIFGGAKFETMASDFISVLINMFGLVTSVAAHENYSSWEEAANLNGLPLSGSGRNFSEQDSTYKVDESDIIYSEVTVKNIEILHSPKSYVKNVLRLPIPEHSTRDSLALAISGRIHEFMEIWNRVNTIALHGLLASGHDKNHIIALSQELFVNRTTKELVFN